MTDPLEAAFGDPVTDAQGCFRAVLAAMSHPGAVCRVDDATALRPPAPLQPAAAAALLTLVDADVSVFIDPEFDAAADWLRFHCGTEIVPRLEIANFVLACRLPPLAELALGPDEAPECSASVILQLASLHAGRGYRLSGPGLAKPRRVEIDGLPADFARRWRANHALYPRGVDLILCAGDELAALPRGVTVENC